MTTLNENDPTPPACCCLFGIPKIVLIPKSGEICPHTLMGRSSFYRLCKIRRFIKLPLEGVRLTAKVFGPSVCDAQYGCQCPQRVALMALRKKIDPNK